MSLINDYSIQYLAGQRLTEFQAEAAADRLARIAVGEPIRRRRIKLRRLRNQFRPLRPAQAH